MIHWGIVWPPVLTPVLIAAALALCGSESAPAELRQARVGSHPNEPAGFTPITERSFDEEDEDGWADSGAPARSGVAASFDIVRDPTGPHSPGGVGRVTFPRGLTGDGSSSRQIRSRVEIGTPKRLYIAFWFKVSDNWYGQDGSSVNKVLYVGHPMVVDAHGNGRSPLYLQLSLQGGENFNGRWNAPENEASPAARDAELVRGRWRHIEILMEMNTPGFPNGALHAWVDGVKTHQFTGRTILRADGDRYSQIGHLDWHPIYGGQNGRAVPETQYQYIDHIYVSSD